MPVGSATAPAQGPTSTSVREANEAQPQKEAAKKPAAPKTTSAKTAPTQKAQNASAETNAKAQVNSSAKTNPSSPEPAQPQQPMFASAQVEPANVAQTSDSILTAKPQYVAASSAREDFNGTQTNGPDGDIINGDGPTLDVADTHEKILAGLKAEHARIISPDYTELKSDTALKKALFVPRLAITSGINFFEAVANKQSRSTGMEQVTQNAQATYKTNIQAFREGTISEDELMASSRRAQALTTNEGLTSSELLGAKSEIFALTTITFDDSAGRSAGATKTPLALIYGPVTAAAEKAATSIINDDTGNTINHKNVWETGKDILSKTGNVAQGFMIANVVEGGVGLAASGLEATKVAGSTLLSSPAHALELGKSAIKSGGIKFVNQSIATASAMGVSANLMSQNVRETDVFSRKNDDGSYEHVRFVSPEKYQQALDSTTVRDAKGYPVVSETITNPQYNEVKKHFQVVNGQTIPSGDFLQAINAPNSNNAKVESIETMDNGDIIATYNVDGRRNSVHIPKEIQNSPVAYRNKDNPLNREWRVTTHDTDTGSYGLYLSGITAGAGLTAFTKREQGPLSAQAPVLVGKSAFKGDATFYVQQDRVNAFGGIKIGAQTSGIGWSNGSSNGELSLSLGGVNVDRHKVGLELNTKNGGTAAGFQKISNNTEGSVGFSFDLNALAAMSGIGRETADNWSQKGFSPSAGGYYDFFGIATTHLNKEVSLKGAKQAAETPLEDSAPKPRTSFSGPAESPAFWAATTLGNSISTDISADNPIKAVWNRLTSNNPSEAGNEAS
jgi:hypothetical protein